MKKNQIIIAAGLVTLAAVSRIICAETHLYNFAPVVAIGLLSGSVLKDKKLAFLLAIAGQFLADLYFQLFPMAGETGFYGVSQIFTYLGLIAATMLGSTMKNHKAANVLFYSVGASTLFFIISNFGFFLQGWNGYSFSGFTKTYVDAIPFYRNTLIGDLAGSAALFSLYGIIRKATAPKMQAA